MAQSINLIPQEEKKEQQKQKIVKFSSVLTIILLVLVVLISGFFWYRKNSLRNLIDAKGVEVEKHRQDIASLSDIEITARELDAKYVLLDGFFDERRRYSVLLQELQKRVPQDTVTINTFTLSGDEKSTINLSGDGLDYISIAKFIDTLSDPDYENAAADMKNLFTSVTLNSVNLDNQDLSVTYFIVVEFDPTLIK